MFLNSKKRVFQSSLVFCARDFIFWGLFCLDVEAFLGHEYNLFETDVVIYQTKKFGVSSKKENVNKKLLNLSRTRADFKSVVALYVAIPG